MRTFDFTPYRRSTVGFDRLFDMLEAYDALRAHAPSPHHIIPGHDPLVMRRFPEVAPGVVRVA